MRSARLLACLFVVMGLVLGWAGAARAQDMGGTTVLVAESDELGPYLTDGEGMTLYLFTKDTEPNVSVCEGDCIANWPAFDAEEPLTLPEGVEGELTRFERPDGTMQVAYNGIPLYYWVQDQAPGDTTGQGVGDVWYIVSPGMSMGGEMGDMSDMGSPEAEMEQPTVFVRQDPALGTILTDPNGMTLYLFTKDTEANVSVCEGDCIANWPAFDSDEPLTLPPTIEGELTRFERADGTTQVAYNGIPLYYWVNDEGPGDTTGQGVGDVWYIVAPGQAMGDAPMMGMPDASPEASMDGTVQVTLSEFTITASQTEFKVGETYTFEVTNEGEFPHELVVEKAGVVDKPLETDEGEAEIEPMEPGESGTLTVTFTEAGHFQLACHVMLHYPMGMALTIHVTE